MTREVKARARACVCVCVCVCVYHCVEKHKSSDAKIDRGVIQTVKQTLERYRSSNLLVQRILCHVD